MQSHVLIITSLSIRTFSTMSWWFKPVVPAVEAVLTIELLGKFHYLHVLMCSFKFSLYLLWGAIYS